MKKSILVVDEVDCCDMCKLGFNNECSDEFECFMEPTKHIENPRDEKPDWCPLRELPEKKPIRPLGVESYVSGWNECIDAVIGREN